MLTLSVSILKSMVESTLVPVVVSSVVLKEIWDIESYTFSMSIWVSKVKFDLKMELLILNWLSRLNFWVGLASAIFFSSWKVKVASLWKIFLTRSCKSWMKPCPSSFSRMEERSEYLVVSNFMYLERESVAIAVFGLG